MFSINKWRDGEQWSNWSRNENARPNEYVLPKSIEDIQKTIKKAVFFKQTVRVTGAGHSFSPVAKPEQIAMSLHEMRGLISLDGDKQEATFYAGTYLHEIGPILEAYHFALINMGDIQEQTLAGVISTGTHGTGVTLGSFSSMVVKWGFVNGLGEYIEHERGEDDLSKALHVSLGLLGILVTVTIKVVPIYNLHYIAKKENLLEAIPSFSNSIRAHRHLEWYYFPGSETIQVKQMDIAAYAPRTAQKRKIDEVKLSTLENGLFYGLSELTKRKPSLSKTVAKISALGISNIEKNDVSYTVFPSPRNVKFNETEHAIPLNRFEEAIEEIHWTFVRNNLNVHFPIECRTTSAEDGFLSPTLGRESAFIAFHMYKGMNEVFYFNWVRELMKKYDSRPHWGKINWYDKEDIYELFPYAETFNDLRNQMDPHGVFMTQYFKNVFK